MKIGDKKQKEERKRMKEMIREMDNIKKRVEWQGYWSMRHVEKFDVATNNFSQSVAVLSEWKKTKKRKMVRKGPK